MRLVLTILVAGLLIGSAANAQPCPGYMPPVNGTYLSTEYGGPILTGRFAESWIGMGGHGQVGNTVNAQSWGGMGLGGQWRLWCPQIAAPAQLIADTRDANGTGEVTWRTMYSGGRLWLTKAGPWSGDGLVDFTASLQSFVATTTYQYVFNQLLGIRSNIVTSGVFDELDPCWSDQCFDYTINNAAFYGSTDMGSLPSDYPGFLDPTFCPDDTPRLQRGGWGDVTHIALRITGCVVPSETPTWGAIKALYR